MFKPPLSREDAEAIGRALVGVIGPAAKIKWFRWDRVRTESGIYPAAIVAMPAVGPVMQLLNVLENASKKSERFDDRP